MYSMEDYLKEALREGDTKMFQQYLDVLKQEGYEASSIKRLASRINKEVTKERKAQKKSLKVWGEVSSPRGRSILSFHNYSVEISSIY